MVGSFDVYRHPNPRFHVDFPSVSCVMGSNDILVLCRRCGRFAHDATFGFPRPLSFFETQAEMVLLRSTDYAASFSEQTVLYRGLAYDPFICMLDGGRLMAGMVIGQTGSRRERNRLEGVLHRHLPDLDAVITIQGIGLWYSDDGGRTWPAEPIMVSVPGWENVYNLRPPVRLRDGTILLPVTIGYPWRSRYVGLLRSWDGGLTWQDPSYVAEDPAGRAQYSAGVGYWQPALAHCDTGRLVCVSTLDQQESAPAADGRQTSGLMAPGDDVPSLMVTRSVDAGFTWSPPVEAELYGDFPSLYPLPDGRLVLTYTMRTGSGAKLLACSSEDGGLAWDDLELIRDSQDCLFYYPSTTVTADGLLTTYMVAGPDRVRYVAATLWDPF